MFPKLSQAVRGSDPLIHHSHHLLGKSLALAASAAFAHVIIGGAIAGTTRLLGTKTEQGVERKMEMLVVEVPSKPPDVAPLEPVPTVAEPEQPAPVVKSPPKRPRVRKPTPVPEPSPPPVVSPKKPQRIVGLNFESTVEGGAGPGFSVGNTRLGKTKTKATDSEKVPRVPGEAPPQAGARTNRAAVAVPGVQLVKPKRKRKIVPSYPPTLRAQGIEGKVVVEVVISPTGRVRKARVIAKSSYDAFNTAALEAARREQFSPAKKAGKPVEFRLSFAYRFRLDD